MSRLYPVVGLLFCLLSGGLQAGETGNATPISRQALGLSAGTIVGNGLLYRYYWGRHFAQATFAGYVNKDNDEEYMDASLSYGNYFKLLRSSKLGFPVGVKGMAGVDAVYDKSEGISDNWVYAGFGIGLDLGSLQEEGLLLSFDMFYAFGFSGLNALEFKTLDMEPSVALIYNF